MVTDLRSIDLWVIGPARSRCWDLGSMPGRDASFDVPESSYFLSGPRLQLESRYTRSRGWLETRAGRQVLRRRIVLRGTVKHVKSTVALDGGIWLRRVVQRLWRRGTLMTLITDTLDRRVPVATLYPDQRFYLETLRLNCNLILSILHWSSLWKMGPGACSELNKSSTHDKLLVAALEAILVIFGRRALIFLFESSWTNMKNYTTFVRMRSGDHLLETQKCWKRALRSVEFNFFILR